jgi:uncharacterized protein GlcG (DUF336 family)
MFERPVLDVEEALAALDAMIAAASRPMSFAIVDDQGDTVCFARMDGSPIRNRTYALDKAYTASRMRMDLTDFVERRKGRSAASYGDARFVDNRQGGTVIVAPGSGEVVGAIGVSGGGTGEDDKVAAIGLEALDLR